MVSRAYVPDAGHLIKIDFNPQAGHEQAGWRPALVLSPASYNQKTGLAVVAPVTSHQKGYPFEVELPSDLKIGGAILADALKSLDWRVRNARFVDSAPDLVMRRVKELVALLLGISID